MTEARASRPPRSGTSTRPRRPEPRRSTEYDHLALDELREYRRHLVEEENRVSYWRRLLQARLDIVRQGSSGSLPNRTALRNLLARDQQATSRRRALVSVVAPDDVPVLPNLVELWDRDPRPDDAAATAQLAEELAAAEQRLSEYRHQLHARIDDATNELVARYRERPALAMRALPLTSPLRPAHPTG